MTKPMEMGTPMLFDSKIKKLPSLKVLEVASQNSNPNTPLDQSLNKLRVEFSLPNVWKLQEGNTIFAVHKSNVPGFGFVKIYNADTFKNMVGNIKVFVDAASKVGFNHLVSQFVEPAFMEAFKHALAGLNHKDAGYVIHHTAQGGYQVIISLGGARSTK